jgi:hypothetical protein
MTFFGFVSAGWGLIGSGAGAGSVALDGPGFIRVMFITLWLGRVILGLKSGKMKNKIRACNSKETASAMEVLRLILMRKCLSPIGGKSNVGAIPA